MLPATTHAPAAIAHEIANSHQAPRVADGVTIAGTPHEHGEDRQHGGVHGGGQSWVDREQDAEAGREVAGTGEIRQALREGALGGHQRHRRSSVEGVRETERQQ